jgi:hypothetical protein
MTDTVHIVTELPSKTAKLRRKAGKVAFYGIFAAGCILLVDDTVKRFSKKSTDDTTETD